MVSINTLFSFILSTFHLRFVFDRVIKFDYFRLNYTSINSIMVFNWKFSIFFPNSNGLFFIGKLHRGSIGRWVIKSISSSSFIIIVWFLVIFTISHKCDYFREIFFCYIVSNESEFEMFKCVTTIHTQPAHIHMHMCDVCVQQQSNFGQNRLLSLNNTLFFRIYITWVCTKQKKKKKCYEFLCSWFHITVIFVDEKKFHYRTTFLFSKF